MFQIICYCVLMWSVYFCTFSGFNAINHIDILVHVPCKIIPESISTDQFILNGFPFEHILSIFTFSYEWIFNIHLKMSKHRFDFYSHEMRTISFVCCSIFHFWFTHRERERERKDAMVLGWRWRQRQGSVVLDKGRLRGKNEMRKHQVKYCLEMVHSAYRYEYKFDMAA